MKYLFALKQHPQYDEIYAYLTSKKHFEECHELNIEQEHVGILNKVPQDNWGLEYEGVYMWLGHCDEMEEAKQSLLEAGFIFSEEFQKYMDEHPEKDIST